MKKFFFFSVMVLSLALMMGCGEKKGNADQPTAKQEYSENYRKAEKCILDYEKAIKAAFTRASHHSPSLSCILRISPLTFPASSGRQAASSRAM